jgi:hypothetical protein
VKPLTILYAAFDDLHDHALYEDETAVYAKDEADAVIRELEAERDAARADAERYRWLRSRVPGSTYRIMGVIYSEGGEGVDAAIDSARGADNGR